MKLIILLVRNARELHFVKMAKCYVIQVNEILITLHLLMGLFSSHGYIIVIVLVQSPSNICVSYLQSAINTLSNCKKKYK